MSRYGRKRGGPRKALRPRRGEGHSDQRRRSRLQVLEDRRVLSITPPTLLVSEAKLVIAGGDLDDTVFISESLEDSTLIVQQSEPGSQLTTVFPREGITWLHFNGNDGDDRLVNWTDIAIYADGGGGDDALEGGSGADTLVGGAGEDRLTGHGGDDTLLGGDGADTLFGEEGHDHLDGGADDDLLYGGAGGDVLLGNEGEDRLVAEEGEDYLNGGAGADLLEGGPDDDFLNGGAGDDRLEGQLGDDTLLGGDGVDTLLGEEGVDHLDGGADDDLLYGGVGDDLLYGRSGADLLLAGAGEDYLNGGSGDDILEGGPDNDFLNGEEGHDRLEGQLGDDTLLGGEGIDTLFGDDGADDLDGGAGNDLLYGGNGDDLLYGRSGADQLLAGTGEDYLNGGSGDDFLKGGDDDDFLNGEDGVDRLEGQLGDDTLLGGNGDDTLFGEEGVDRLDGGKDNDTLYGGVGGDLLYGRSGADLLVGEGGEDYLNGGSGDDLLKGGDDNDFLNGEDGVDRLEGQLGDDALLGGDGADTLFGDDGSDYLDGGRDDDSLYGGGGEDLLYGRSGADLLVGEGGEDYLNGGSDDDFLKGGGDDDFLNGEDGVDRLEGQLGDDTLLGGAGIDTLFGDDGSDYLDGGADDDYLYGGAGGDAMFGRSGADQLIAEAGIDYLSGGVGNDHLEGGEGDDSLIGGDGDDRLEGQLGDDTLLGEAGNDVLHGDDGNDVLRGGDGDDDLYGGEGNDLVYGDAGADLIQGSAGNDRLHGGNDNDRLLGGVGDDELLGDAGEDRLEGDEGADLLLGGEGDDYLVAGEGDDFAIGGGGRDTVLGSAGEDVLIGASTAYDAQVETLRAALAVWNADLSYELRVGHLSSHHNGFELTPHETVFADLVADTLYGEAGQDWFVLSATNGTYNPLGMAHQQGSTDSHGSHGSGHQQAILLHHPPALEGFALIDSIDQLADMNASEMVHTRLSHNDDPSKLGEHLRMRQLVRYADVTHTAVASGDWTDPSTWEGGLIPTADARVLIPYGASVTVDGVVQEDLFSVRVDGTLSFSVDSDSELRVDTVVVTNTGAFHMGTHETPVQAGVTARLLITDGGPIDQAADPFSMGRGLITHGQVRLHGAEVTPFATANGDVRANDTTIRLATTPTGWSVGDKIAIAGTGVGTDPSEVREILAINGAELTVEPLDHDHVAFESGLDVHVTNLDRNVVIESAATVSSRRGHVMFMHNRDIHVSHAEFNGLGRTDKSFTLTDPQVDADWNLIPGTGDNPRGRYAVHFHRNGVRADSPPATVHGSVVNGGPGWGFVNHSSYIDFTGNVAIGVNGAAFVSEAGDEIGLFDGNLAINTTGTDADVNSRVGAQDFGFNGDGFWFQGPGVTVTNNIASGSTGSAFIYYTRGLRFAGHETQFLAENLDDPTIAGGSPTIRVIATPIKEFRGNVGYASNVGLTLRYHLRFADHAAQSLVSDSTFWNNETGVDIPYSHNTLLRDLTVLVDPGSEALNGVDNNAHTSSITYEDLRVEGYKRGIVVPTQGANVVDGGSFVSKNANLMIRPADVSGLQVLVTGDPQFGSVTNHLAKDIAMSFQTENDAQNPNQVFYGMEVSLQYGPYSDHRLYFTQQHADAVPFPEPLVGLPSAYVGLAHAELFDQFGVAIAGEIAPEDAQSDPKFLGLVAPVGGSLLG